MEPQEYRAMYGQEETHWWYRGLRDLICSTIRDIYGPSKIGRILDGGCGTGGLLINLGSYDTPFGVDISSEALGYCLKRGLHRLTMASVTALPFKSESFDLVVSNDVLYHKMVEDDEKAIDDIHRILKRGGYVIINVPAHENLRRSHDERVHTRHRYNMAELLSKMKRHRFVVIRMSYRNSFLFPFARLFSIFGIGRNNKGRSDLSYGAGPLNSFLYAVLKLENMLLKRVDLPFGTSIFCVAKKI